MMKQRTWLVAVFLTLAVGAGAQDLNQDGRVDTDDLLLFVSAYGQDVAAVTQGLAVEVCDSQQAQAGTTLFNDGHDPQRPRIVEVDLQGNVVWEYVIPEQWREFTDPGMDAERLDSGNTLIVLPRKGIIEVAPDQTIVWSHWDAQVSHDADRLANGNTLYAYGARDAVGDAVAREVTPDGGQVWAWDAQAAYNHDPYAGIENDGWTHANAVTRLASGNTMISLRNFMLTVEVNPAGDVVWSQDWTPFGETVWPHEPEYEAGANTVLIALQDQSPYQAVEVDKETGETVWTYAHTSAMRTTRDADRLPNGNTLLAGVLVDEDNSTIIEVTPAGEVVWQLTLKGYPVGRNPGWFYKAQRIPTTR